MFGAKQNTRGRQRERAWLGHVTGWKQALLLVFMMFSVFCPNAHTYKTNQTVKGYFHNHDEIFKSKTLKNCTSIKKLQTLINYITDTETHHKVLKNNSETFRLLEHGTRGWSKKLCGVVFSFLFHSFPLLLKEKNHNAISSVYVRPYDKKKMIFFFRFPGSTF